MRCLLLALSVALACGAPSIFVPQTGENVDVQKVAGTWYPIAMVASDIALLNTESAPLRLYVKELKPTAQGGLEVTVRRWEDGSCVETKMLAEKTDVPASFQISNLKDGNVVPIPELAEGKVHLLDTDYKNFMFLCTEAAASAASAASAKQILACQYLARTPKADQVAMEQFNRAMELFPMSISLTFAPTQAPQAEGRCRI